MARDQAGASAELPSKVGLGVPWMAVEGVGVGAAVRRYSKVRRRSLIAMTARRAIRKMNGSASIFLVKPMVVMAARVLGPGPTRLRLVKLAHNLAQTGDAPERVELSLGPQNPAVQTTRRAA